MKHAETVYTKGKDKLNSLANLQIFRRHSLCFLRPCFINLALYFILWYIIVITIHTQLIFVVVHCVYNFTIIIVYDQQSRYIQRQTLSNLGNFNEIFGRHTFWFLRPSFINLVYLVTQDHHDGEGCHRGASYSHSIS